MGFRVKTDSGPHAGSATHQHCNLGQETGGIFNSKIGIKIAPMSHEVLERIKRDKAIKALGTTSST